MSERAQVNDGEHRHQVPQGADERRREPGMAAVREQPTVQGVAGPQRVLRRALPAQHAAALCLPARHDAPHQVRAQRCVVPRNDTVLFWFAVWSA